LRPLLELARRPRRDKRLSAARDPALVIPNSSRRLTRLAEGMYSELSRK
jgi:hypothetical protein